MVAANYFILFQIEINHCAKFGAYICLVMIFPQDSTIIAEDSSAGIPGIIVICEETLMDIIVHYSLINHVVRLNSFQDQLVINHIKLNI